MPTANATDTATARRHQPLVAALQFVVQYLNGIGGVDHAFIAGRDGLLVASSRPEAGHADIYAAVVAAMFGAIDRAATSIDLGSTRAALIETPSASLQLFRLADLLLVVVAEKQANMASIRNGVAQAAAFLTKQAHVH